MQILTDIITALDFRQVGKTLSKRSPGMVTGTFLILVVLYVIVYSMFYGAIAGDFVDAMLKISKPSLPSFSIKQGQLTMQSPEPYIITQNEVYKIFTEAVLEVNKKRFGGKGTEAIQASITQQKNTSRDTFCLVMDTTGAYKDRINVANFGKYAVITKESMEIVDRVQNMPGNLVPIKDRIKQDIAFGPDTVDKASGPLKGLSSTLITIALALYTPIRFLIKALIGALVGWIVILMGGRKARFGELYKIALYALAPVVLLAVIDRFFLVIPAFVYQAVYFAYIIVGALGFPKTNPAQQ